jgi:hypothetical protein
MPRRVFHTFSVHTTVCSAGSVLAASSASQERSNMFQPHRRSSVVLKTFVVAVALVITRAHVSTVPSEIVIYVTDVPAFFGAWSVVDDSSAAAGKKARTTDGAVGGAVIEPPYASPNSYFDVTFPAPANTQYRVWLRIRPEPSSKLNDSLWVQFSDALTDGAPNYRIGSTTALLVNLATDNTGNGLRGWGWQNTAYWLPQQQTIVTFASSGTHTLRVQVREDGAQLDQIVLSPIAYFSGPPGPTADDTAIVRKPSGNTAPSIKMASPVSCATFTTGATIPLQAIASDIDGTVQSVDFIADPNIPLGSATADPYTVNWSPAAGTYTVRARATDNSGAQTWSDPIDVTVQAAPPGDIVIYASDVPTASLSGAWAFVADGSAAAGVKLKTADGAAGSVVIDPPLASPTHYFDVTFSAPANTTYTLWLRMQAEANSKLNDSLWVQFSDALTGGAPNYRMNTTSALLVNLATDAGATSLNHWGWRNTAYWLSQPTAVTFFLSGTHTLRIQLREDGVELDQIVLSPVNYATNPPGPVGGDNTIVPKSSGPSTIGQWCAPTPWQFVAIHAHLLPNGKVLAWDRQDTDPNSTQTWVWNPAKNSAPDAFTSVMNTRTNLFCSGHSFLPDGRLLATGGHIADFRGKLDTNVYDFNANQWSAGPNMNLGRWYPTNTTLGNGDVTIVSGLDASGAYNATPQVWQSATGQLRNLTTAVAAQDDLDVYPRMLLASNGTVFDAAPKQITHFLDATVTGAWTQGPTSGGGYRDYGSAVMYAEGKVLITGGGTPLKSTELIDIGPNSTPVWNWSHDMNFARRQMNATLLPDGQVLATGGTSTSGDPSFSDPAGAVFAAEMWDPSTEVWTTMASMQVKRLYHSIAMLLPDGRVLSAGGGRPANLGGGDHADAEMYLPPYLFKGARPVISTAPTTVGYGQQFFVQTPNTDIQKVRWIRLPSVTHAFNENQWTNDLEFTITQGGLTVTAPAATTPTLVHCPPGHYMLFLINNAGVPSPGVIVRIQ